MDAYFRLNLCNRFHKFRFIYFTSLGDWGFTMKKCLKCDWEFTEDEDQIETFDNQIICSPCFIKKENETESDEDLENALNYKINKWGLK